MDNHAKTVRDALSKNVVVDIGARLGYLGSRFFIPPFVLAHVGLDAYGLWATAFIIVSYVGISTIGISNVYIKYVAEYTARGEPQRANALLSTGLITTSCLCLIMFMLLLMCWPIVMKWLQIPEPLQDEAREVILLVVGIFLASLAFSGFSNVLTGVQRQAMVQAIWVVAYVVETGLIFLLISQGRGIRGLAEAFLVRMLLEIALSALVAFRTLPWLKISPRLCTRASLRLLVSFGGTVQILGFLAIVLNSIERAIAVPLIGLQAAGLLDIGKKLPGMAASIPSAFAASFVPAASYLEGGLTASKEGREALTKLYLKGARYMNLAAGYVCGLLAAAPLPILDVWLGKRYPGAGFLMVIFAVATQIHLMTGPGTSILKGLGRPREEFWYAIPNILILFLAVPLSYALLGEWTALGIGAAVAISTVLSALYFIRWANHLLGVAPMEYVRAVVFPGLVPYPVALLFAVPAVLMVPQTTRVMGAVVLTLIGMVYTGLLAGIVDRMVFESGERLWFHAVVRQHLGRLLPQEGMVPS